jgi:hypothetical protein
VTLSVAVIVAVPVAMPVINPPADTVAMAGFDDCQIAAVSVFVVPSV